MDVDRVMTMWVPAALGVMVLGTLVEFGVPDVAKEQQCCVGSKQCTRGEDTPVDYGLASYAVIAWCIGMAVLVTAPELEFLSKWRSYTVVGALLLAMTCQVAFIPAGLSFAFFPESYNYHCENPDTLPLWVIMDVKIFTFMWNLLIMFMWIPLLLFLVFLFFFSPAHKQPPPLKKSQ
eukprot:m.342873 g.342873  ORF g.342873 m.342873 type:complete len:177 (-) comp16127_c5_seq1:1830-2360(-)